MDIRCLEGFQHSDFSLFDGFDQAGSFSIGFGCLDDRILFLTEVHECGRKLWILSMPLKGFRVFFPRNEYFCRITTLFLFVNSVQSGVRVSPRPFCNEMNGHE